MRTHLDPLDPNQSTLRPSIQRISELSMSLNPVEEDDDITDTLSEQIRWAIQLPERIRQLLSANHRSIAESEMQRLQVMLEKWDHVSDKQELLNQCKAALAFGQS
jgi:hypothetical protein